MIDHGVLLNSMGDPKYSWDVPTLALKLGPVPAVVGTIVKLGRNSHTCTRLNTIINNLNPPSD